MDLSVRKRVLFTIIAVLICLVSLEGALQLVGVVRSFYSERRTEPVVPPNIGQFDRLLGWSLKPFSHGISKRTGYEIQYQINSKGLRDKEISYEKPRGIFRIVLLGDSNTFGFGVPIEKHFSTLLEGYFRNVEVINMGVNGYGIDQMLLFLRAEGFKYKPDLVIAYVPHYGDHRHMHTVRFGQEKPCFKIIDRKLVLTNSPISVQEHYGFLGPGIIRDIHRWLRRHSKVFEFLSDGTLHLIRYQFTENPKKNQLNQANQQHVKNLEQQRLKDVRKLNQANQQHVKNLEQQTIEDMKNLENERFRKELIDLGEGIIDAMHEESRSHGAVFVLVTMIPELHEAACKRQIFSLDVFMSMFNPGFALPDNLKHVNEAGNGVIAWEIAKFLKTNRLIPAEHLTSPFIRVQVTWQSRKANIGNMSFPLSFGGILIDGSFDEPPPVGTMIQLQFDDTSKSVLSATVLWASSERIFAAPTVDVQNE